MTEEQQIPETLTAAIRNYAELEDEVEHLEASMEDVRAIIKAEVVAIGGKVKIPHVATVSIVPASTSHSYDTAAIDKLVLDLFADGTKEGIAIAQALVDMRKKSNRKESLRIVLDRGKW